MPQGAPLLQKSHPIKPKKAYLKKVKQILTISYKKKQLPLYDYNLNLI